MHLIACEKDKNQLVYLSLIISSMYFYVFVSFICSSYPVLEKNVSSLDTSMHYAFMFVNLIGPFIID